MDVRLSPYLYKKVYLNLPCLSKVSFCVWLTRMPRISYNERELRKNFTLSASQARQQTGTPI